MFWSFVNNKKGKTRIPGTMRHNDEELHNPQDIVEAFSRLFEQAFPHSEPNDTIDIDLNIGVNFPSLNVNNLSEEEITDSIKKLKNKMTSGPDCIPSFLIRDCAYVLCQPLKILFNLSLKLGTFPDIWKKARVCPILKQGDSSDIANYRPITLLCNFAKVFEMSLYNRIYPLVKNVISVDQHGFMEKRSTTTNLLCFTQCLSDNIDMRGQVDVIYTDFSKAFDRIDHCLLLSKLQLYGCSTVLVQFFSSYLTNRLNYVTYNGFTSNPYTVTSGVPQGSNLGPLFFALFVNDLNDTLSCKKLFFADDLKIFASINSIDDCHMLQRELNKVAQWCHLNSLVLNITKCKVVTYSRKDELIDYDYHIDTQSLSRTDSTRDLGVFFDSKLSFAKHIELTVSSSMKTLGFILRLSQVFHDNGVLIKLFYCYIRSKLEYCSLIWSPIYEYQVKSIESVLRKFLKFLCFRTDGRYPNRGCDQTYLLNRFNFDSLQFRRQFYSVKFLYLLIHNRVDCPPALSQLNFLVPRAASRNPLTFYCQPARTNIMLKSPIFVICSNYNSICDTCDIFNCSINTIYTSLKNCSIP